MRESNKNMKNCKWKPSRIQEKSSLTWNEFSSWEKFQQVRFITLTHTKATTRKIDVGLFIFQFSGIFFFSICIRRITEKNPLFNKKKYSTVQSRYQRFQMRNKAFVLSRSSILSSVGLQQMWSSI